MPRLPEELYHEILLRLPVKSLLRSCKFVCKSWFKLISDSDFVKSQLNLTVQKNNPSIMLRCANKNTTDNRVIQCSINYDPLSSQVTEMDYPFKPSGSTVKLVGSCNGLVCIWTNSFFCIWNPATKEYKKVPESLNKHLSGPWGLIAFGYDCKSDDYKLACVHDNVDENDTCLVEVYTLGSDSWISIRTISYWHSFGNSAVLINGALHWLGTGRHNFSPNLLISFDINTNKFKELQLPKKSLENHRRFFFAVGVLEGCPCVLVGDCNLNIHEVWVMQDYRVQESWTKITIHTRFINNYPSGKLITSLKNGKILFLSRGNLVIYDPKQGSARQLNVCSTYVVFTSGVQYFESLVSLNSGTYSDIEAHIEGSSETRKGKSL